LAQDLLGWINLKPPSGLAANVGNAAVWDGFITRSWHDLFILLISMCTVVLNYVIKTIPVKNEHLIIIF